MVLRMTLRRSPERSPTIHHDLLWSPVATIAVLSAGASPFLSNILASVTAIARSHDVVRLIWSGRALPPCWIPNTVDVVVIPPPSFDHGGTRQLALELCHTEFLVLLSDDAEPANSCCQTTRNPRTPVGWPDCLIPSKISSSQPYMAGKRPGRPLPSLKSCFVRPDIRKNPGASSLVCLGRWSPSLHRMPTLGTARPPSAQSEGFRVDARLVKTGSSLSASLRRGGELYTMRKPSSGIHTTSRGATHSAVRCRRAR